MVNVYISSTFTDLRNCRRQVADSLRRMHHTDVAMEHYGAVDARPLDKCLADVAACDLYICVVAWRYGYIPAGSTESITELEYRQATESGKPRLVFLLSEDALWPKKLIDNGAAEKRVEAFRDKLREDRIVAEFTDETDLGRKVGEAIYNWERSQGLTPAEGRADWESYRRAVFDTHRWVRLAVIAGAKQDRRSEIPLTEVFVTQPVQSGPPEYDVPEDPSRSDPELDFSGPPAEPSLAVLSRERRQVFLGAPGSGKSTLLLTAMLQLCDSGRDLTTLPPSLRHAPLPFLIELRQYVLDPATSFVEYLSSNAHRQYGVEIDQASIEAVLAGEDRALILFDGLDEIFDSHAQSQVVEEFRTFARRHPHCRLVVTSRIPGYRALELERDGFRHYTLLGFGMPEIREFVPKWYTYYTWQGDSRDAPGLIRRIADSPRLLELAGNPLLLTMMAVIYKHQDLPEKRWQLYARCTEVLLEDWDVKRKNIDRNELLPLGFTMIADQKAELLQRVSMHMLQQCEDSELNAIARTPLLKILAEYLQEQYGKSIGESRAIAAEILNHLRERTYIIAEIGDGLFGFVHRTFMEFFAAEHCKSEFNRLEADYSWLTSDLFEPHWNRDEWREILLLLIAMLKNQGSPVRKVIDHIRNCHSHGLPTQLAFAARCLAEAGTVDDSWSRSLVNGLAEAIHSAAGRSNDAMTRSFLDDALGSFAMLAPTIAISPQTRASIDDLGSSGRPLPSRMVAFQLQLALRSRDERLPFAIEALNQSEEAIQRGAISALEREWPANEKAFAALLTVVRSNRRARVRSAALQALDRGWPPDPEILRALGERGKTEGAYAFIVDIVKYLGSRWSGDRRALEIILRLSKPGPLAGMANYDLTAVRNAIVGAIHTSWKHTNGCRALLRDQWLTVADSQAAVTAIVALIHAWPDDPELVDWIKNQLIKEPEPLRRRLPLVALLRARRTDRDLCGWARQIVVDDKDHTIAEAVLANLPFSVGDVADLAWLEQRVHTHPDAIVRERALQIWSSEHQPGNIPVSLLRDWAVRDSAWQVRRRALILLDGGGHNEILQQFLHQRAIDEPDPRVRVTAISALGDDDSAVAVLMRAQSSVEPNASVRMMALLRLTMNVPGAYRSLSNLARIQVRIDPDYPVRELDADHIDILRALVGDIRFAFLKGKPLPGLNVVHDLDFLRIAAREDNDTIVRTFALFLLVAIAPEDSTAWELVEHLLMSETDHEIHRLISELRSIHDTDGSKGSGEPGSLRIIQNPRIGISEN